ncbi:MAG: hypothetical protein CMK09_09200 [Ponticaulis sp.]|nr:hypothetical protein [Ponticaulis sp.]|tara:strand:- start:8300 stop:8698 length:399 start_codon:yes stop_codon:yes gene_type:complete
MGSRPDFDNLLAAWPPAAQTHFRSLRDLLFLMADDLPETGGLSESLKWGEPSFAPIRPRTGTAIQLAWKHKTPDSISLFVNCQTHLIERRRAAYPDLHFVGNREIRIPLDQPIPAEIAACARDALCYFKRSG